MKFECSAQIHISLQLTSITVPDNTATDLARSRNTSVCQEISLQHEAHTCSLSHRYSADKTLLPSSRWILPAAPLHCSPCYNVSTSASLNRPFLLPVPAQVAALLQNSASPPPLPALLTFQPNLLRILAALSYAASSHQTVATTIVPRF